MRVLLDNNLDHRFGRLLTGHEVTPARRLGWAEPSNGALITAGEEAGFDVPVTGDKNLRYQQNLTGRRISVVTLDALLVDLKGTALLAPLVVQTLADLPSRSFIVVCADPETS